METTKSFEEKAKEITKKIGIFIDNSEHKQGYIRFEAGSLSENMWGEVTWRHHMSGGPNGQREYFGIDQLIRIVDDLIKKQKENYYF